MHSKIKIGRNEPCPCGSRKINGFQKKYKQCCIGQVPSFSLEFAQKINTREQERTKKEHSEFISSHNRGECYLCSLPYDQYEVQKPCIHWVFRPSNIEKDKIALAIKKFGYFKLEAFLRWIANTECYGSKINDLREEGDSSKVIETTIIYKNFEWSFSCGKGDFEGHKNGLEGTSPHFHLQMKIDQKRFISFNDYHFPFDSYDFFIFRVKRGDEPGIRYEENYGMGMSGLLNTMADNNLRGMKIAPNEETAQFRIQTLIVAKPGFKISGDEVSDLMEESKRTGTPMSKLLHCLKGVKVTTIVEPGSGVPEKKSRSKRKTNNEKSITREPLS